jgi:hypothetical protein
MTSWMRPAMPPFRTNRGRSLLAKAVLITATAVLVQLAACSKPTSQSAATGPSSKLAAPVGSSDVLMQHGNPQRTGATLTETRLTPTTVRGGSFGRLFEWTVDGQIYTQPLYVSNVAYGGRQINMVVVATTNNSVYAFEAPPADSDVKPADGALWWTRNDVLGAPLPFNFFWMPSGIFGYNIYPQIGITATPVIDRKSQTIYVTVKSQGSQTAADAAAAVK